MFKNIQKQLLLKYPLIWNTKFVPMLAIGILFQILYFGIGYLSGSIDFSGKVYYESEISSVLFGILIAILTFIVWLVYYFKNNAFKSFYSKSKNALFYEWFQIFVISLLLVSFYLPFSIGKQLHERSYFSEIEATKRCKTIALADIFIDGYFAKTEIDSTKSVLKDSIINGEYRYTQLIYKDSMFFQAKKYSEFSLMNRRSYDFSLISREQDSLNNIEIKNWLVDNQSNKVKKLMSDYLKIVNQHNLKTNLETEKWFEEVYKYPHFTGFSYIKPYFEEYETETYYKNSSEIATKVTPRNQNIYSNYFVQQDVLKSKYTIISNAHTNSFIDYEGLIAFLCGAFGLSLLVFSFKVTSGKSWLIAVVSIGVLNIIFGILSLFTSSGFTYAYLTLISFLAFVIYFASIYFKRKNEGYSKIVLNILLWTFPFIIPLVYELITDYYQRNFKTIKYGYYSPEYNWLQENQLNMLILNLIFCFCVLFYMSRIIRNWKGIAEE